ncbi:hypothetical protein ACFYY2_17525 [Streptomyces sp. NPDC001822]|uniref:hypothetical protein n=1 Tax=Streptomyces sp. NPDC001822 TaxID=3364614 RepID=UPI0036AB1F79
MYPTLFSNPGVKQFAEEIDAERGRQLRKFGEQHHRDGTSLANADWADHARAACQHAADEDALSWAAVLYEEFTEALAEVDPAKLRAELIQVAAVCAAWIHDIDSRATNIDTQPAGTGADRIVAYRNTDRPSVLLCRQHGDGWMGLTPLTSEDLPDGGFCTWGVPDEQVCGRDVLIAPPTA